MPEKRLVIARADNPTGFKVVNVRLVNDQLQERIDEALSAAEDLTLIQTEGDKQQFIAVETHIEDVWGEIAEIHRLVKQPFLDACRKIDEAKRVAESSLKAASERLRKEMSRVYGGKRREQQDEQREIQAYAEKKWEERAAETDLEKREELTETAIRAQMTAESVVTTVPGIKIRTDWNVELVDPLLALQTHPKLVATAPDLREVKAAIKKLKEEGVEIKEDSLPGFKLTPKDSVTLRR